MFLQSQAHAVKISRFNVWRILQDHDMHPFQVRRIQALQTDDNAPSIAFALWYLGKYATDPLFPAKVLFSDEESFKKGRNFQHA